MLPGHLMDGLVALCIIVCMVISYSPSNFTYRGSWCTAGRNVFKISSVFMQRLEVLMHG